MSVAVPSVKLTPTIVPLLEMLPADIDPLVVTLPPRIVYVPSVMVASVMVPLLEILPAEIEPVVVNTPF